MLSPINQNSAILALARRQIAMLLMGEVHCVQGRFGQALTHFDKADAISEESGDERFLWGQHIYRIPVYLFGGALEQAEQVVLDSTESVIHQLYQIGGRYYLAELLWLRGRAWLAMKDNNRAKDAFLKAKAVAEDTSERTILWQILVRLAELESICEDETESEKLMGRRKKP